MKAPGVGTVLLGLSYGSLRAKDSRHYRNFDTGNYDRLTRRRGVWCVRVCNVGTCTHSGSVKSCSCRAPARQWKLRATVFQPRAHRAASQPMLCACPWPQDVTQGAAKRGPGRKLPDQNQPANAFRSLQSSQQTPPNLSRWSYDCVLPRQTRQCAGHDCELTRGGHGGPTGAQQVPRGLRLDTEGIEHGLGPCPAASHLVIPSK